MFYLYVSVCVRICACVWVVCMCMRLDLWKKDQKRRKEMSMCKHGVIDFLRECMCVCVWKRMCQNERRKKRGMYTLVCCFLCCCRCFVVLKKFQFPSFPIMGLFLIVIIFVICCRQCVKGHFPESVNWEKHGSIQWEKFAF